MEGPNDETRAWIAEEALRLAEAGQAGEDDQWVEAELAGLLEAIARAISDDVGVEGEVAVDLESATYVLDAVQMWASGRPTRWSPSTHQPAHFHGDWRASRTA